MQLACRHHLRFGLWAQFQGGKYNNRNNNPYKNNRDPTCWLGPLITRTASSYAGVQEVCISPAQRDKKCVFSPAQHEASIQNATVNNMWI